MKSTFYLPLRFLPRAARKDTFTLYNFCRTADNIVDSLSNEFAPERLAALEDYIKRVYDKPSFRNPLALVIHRHELKQALFEEFLRGMKMDLVDEMYAPSLTTLELYCYRVAGCVGELLLTIWGDRSAVAPVYARALGEALQLTNILRDIHEDAARGRLYLPREWLEEVGLTPSLDALNAPSHIVRALCLRLAERAEECFVKAAALHPQLKPYVQLPTRWIAGIYHALLRKLVAVELPVQQPPQLNLWEHMHIAFKARFTGTEN